MRNPTFIIICILGAANLIASLTSFTGGYGERHYPVTYSVIDSINGAFGAFLYAIIVFYSGVMVWRERDARFNEIQDAAPVPSGTLFVSKFLAMLGVCAVVHVLTAIIGMVAQTCYGYYRYEPGLYATSLLGLGLITNSFFIVIALFFHYLINNRYVAWFAFIAFVIVNLTVWSALKIDNNMLIYGSAPSIIYSDMNGFGPFLAAANWFHLYWSLFALLLLFIVHAFYVRGKENNFKARWAMARTTLARNAVVVITLLVLFVACSGFVYYNTSVLNRQESPSAQEEAQVHYERTYRKYINAPQPRFYRIDFHIDLFPEQRNMDLKATAWLRNISGKPIGELYLNLPTIADTVITRVAGATIALNDKAIGFRILKLAQPLQPGDSLLMEVSLSRRTKGFENEVTFNELTANGTFFNNTDIMPRLGYDEQVEL
ncbi:MAG: hypothetical protein EBZ77_15740, partial [Chitinophagia bacterium]|nr:hypothetical protein [Chitinophagia bacterium]